MSAPKTKLPTLYIPHGGGPCFFMDWSPIGPKDTWNSMESWLKSIPSSLPAKPKAILVITAHWEAPEFTVLKSERPVLLFDYSGFPKHTYELTYPAQGDLKLAARIEGLLKEAGIPVKSETKRGIDHGVFIPMKVAYPNADIPIVALSLKENLDPRDHVKLGQALAPLREEGVLIVGSGMSYHNLRELFSGRDAEHSREFDDWLHSALSESNPDLRSEKLIAWDKAPHARRAHPREEHFIPLMVALGAAGSDPVTRVYNDRVMGAVTSAYQFG